MKIKNGEYHEEDAADEEPVRIESASVCSQVKWIVKPGHLQAAEPKLYKQPNLVGFRSFELRCSNEGIPCRRIRVGGRGGHCGRWAFSESRTSSV